MLFYIAALAVILAYVLIVFALNQIPHVQVKSLGWMSLHRVSVELPTASIYIHRIKLRFQLFRRAEHTRWLHLELFDIDITLKDAPAVKKEHRPVDISEIVERLKTLPMTNRAFNVLYTYRMSSMFSIHLFRFRVIVEDPVMMVEYIRVGQAWLSEERVRFQLYLLDGYLEDKEAVPELLTKPSQWWNRFVTRRFAKLSRVPIFRSIDFTVEATIVTRCDISHSSKVMAAASEIAVSTSFSKVFLDVDQLKDRFKPESRHKEKKHHSLPKALSWDTNSLIELFQSMKIKLDDLTIKKGNLEISTTNFATSVQATTDGVIPARGPPGSRLKWSLYLTALKLIDTNSKCVDIPSVAYSCIGNFVEFYNSVSSFIHDIPTEISVESTLTVSAPQFDLYYDQYESLLQRQEEEVESQVSSQVSSPTKTPLASPFTDSEQGHPRHGPKKFPPLLARLFNSLNLVSVKFVMVDISINLHLPEPGTHHSTKFNRKNTENIVTKINIMSVVNRVFTRNFKHMMRRNVTMKNRVDMVLLVKNWRMEVLGNSFHLPKLNLLATADASSQSISVKFQSKAWRIKSVNDVIFRMVRHIRNQQIEHYNKEYGYLASQVNTPVQSPQKNVFFVESLGDPGYINLFERIPDWISRVTVSIDSISADILCKDGLPSHVIYDKTSGHDIDMGDFKRGVSIRLDGIEGYVSVHKKKITSKVRMLQMFTLSEYSNEFICDFDDMASYMSSESEFSDISSVNSNGPVMPEDDSSVSHKIKRVFQVQDMVLNNGRVRKDEDENKTNDENHLYLDVSEVDGRIDMFFIWSTCYARSLIKVFSPTVKRMVSKEQVGKILGRRRTLKLDVVVGSVSAVIRLPNSVDIMLEFDNIRGEDVVIRRELGFDYIRLYAVHPATKYWTRVVVIKAPRITSIEPPAHEVDIVADSFRIQVPENYAMYTIIDNVITFFKAIKQIKYNFAHYSNDINDYKRLMPAAMHPPNVPEINIRTKNFGVCLESDPFEVELSFIYELGRVEQRERLQKLELFEQEAEQILSGVSMTPSSSVEDDDEKSALSNESPPQLRPRQGTTTNGSNGQKRPKRSATLLRKVISDAGHIRDKMLRRNKSIAVGDVYDTISENPKQQSEVVVAQAKNRLNEEVSASWIKRFQAFRHRKVELLANQRDEIYGVDEVSKVMTNKHDILDHPLGPYLFSAICSEVNWTISKAKVDSIDEFLHKWAKGQPHFKYSILIPVYVHFRAKSLQWMLSDYPLPVICFPEPSKPSEVPTVAFKGNLVINEKLVERVEEMRHIFVPFSPAAPVGDEADVFYSVYIPRTLQPIKFVVNMRCDLITDRPCVFAWSKSISPAMSAASAAFDNFSKPPVDLSPIGWWDKFALMIHGRLNFYVPHVLSLSMKSGTSPYDLGGKDSGFVFSWRNNVTFKIFDTQNPKELLQLNADDFVLAVPNYGAMRRAKHDYGSVVVDVHEKRFRKSVVKLTSLNRVQWTFGWLFERNLDHSKDLGDTHPRTHEFMPHYDVVITNPRFCGDRDSYLTYRSDYIHMAFSVVSMAPEDNPDGARNNGYFTPLAFNYFFYWWDCIHKGISLPIRQGPLFASTSVHKKKKHVKMSMHIYTVKYLLRFNPMTITHTYQHPSEVSRNSKESFTGIKARFQACTIDLHQRKELVPYVHEELCVNNKVPHLKMNKGEINGDSVDVRIVEAVFDDPSMGGRMLASSISLFGHNQNFSDYTGNLPQHHKKMDYNQWLHNHVHVFDNDYSWVDMCDFVELERPELLSPNPKIDVLSFAFSPKISYFREFSYYREGPYPFGSEPVHNCTIGEEKPEKTQEAYLKQRMAQLKQQMDAADEKDKPDLQDKIDVVESLEEVFSSNQVHPIRTHGSMTSSRAGNINDELEKVKSAPLSLYSSHVSELDKTNARIKDSESQKFRNRFIVHNMRLKWNNRVRNLFKTYLQLVATRKQDTYCMTRNVIDYVESSIQERCEKRKQAEEDEISEANDEDRNRSSENVREPPKIKHQDFFGVDDVIEKFFTRLNKVDSPNLEMEDKYLVKLIHPQIQLRSEQDVKSSIIVTTRDLQIRLVSVVNRNPAVEQQLGDLKTPGQNEWGDTSPGDSSDVTRIFEARIGVLLEDYQAFVFRRDEVKNPSVGYKSSFLEESMWPPWLHVEVFYDASWLQNQLVVERNSLGFILFEPNRMYLENAHPKQENKLDSIEVQLAKIVLNATSMQYSTIYYVITDLLIHTKDAHDQMLDRLEKIAKFTALDEFEGLTTVVSGLQKRIRESEAILNHLDYYQADKKTKKQMWQLLCDTDRMHFQLKALIQGVTMSTVNTKDSKDSKSKSHQMWNIMADQIIWHVLSSNRDPMVDLALHNLHFTKLDAYDGSKVMVVVVQIIQGFNLTPGAQFPDMLAPLDDSNTKPMIDISWRKLEPVGGIPIVENALVHIQPLAAQLDMKSAKFLYSYLFPDHESSPVNTSTQMGPDPDASDAPEIMSMSSLSSGSILSAKATTQDQTPVKTHSRTNSASTVSSSPLPGKRFRPLSKLFNKHKEIKTDVVLSLTDDVVSPIVATNPNNGHSKSSPVEDVNAIFDRSSTYMSIVDIDISEFILSVSFKAPNHLKILDVYQLNLKIPHLQYKDKIWSSADIVLQIRKDIIKTLVGHTGKILGNKLRPHRKNRIQEPLKMISDYRKYMTVNDLQEEGRSRDSSKTTDKPHRHKKPSHVKTSHYNNHHHLAPLSRQESNSSTSGLEQVLQEIAEEDQDDGDKKDLPKFVEGDYDMT